MIDLLRVFSFLADHPPQCPPQLDTINGAKNDQHSFSRLTLSGGGLGQTYLTYITYCQHQTKEKPHGRGLRNFGISNPEGCNLKLLDWSFVIPMSARVAGELVVSFDRLTAGRPAGAFSVCASISPALRWARTRISVAYLIRSLSLAWRAYTAALAGVKVRQQSHGAGHAQAQRQGFMVHCCQKPLHGAIARGQAMHQHRPIACARGPSSAFATSSMSCHLLKLD